MTDTTTIYVVEVWAGSGFDHFSTILDYAYTTKEAAEKSGQRAVRNQYWDGYTVKPVTLCHPPPTKKKSK